MEIACPEPFFAALVPNLILQPLVENAVRYAVAPSGGASAIHIAVTARHEHLTIAITDGGAPDAHLVGQGSGVGLENIRPRLAALYGARARLETVQSDAGFTARLRLPLAFTPAPGVQETGLVACFRPLAS